MKQKIRVGILGVILIVVIMMAGIDSSYAVDGKIYPIKTSILGRDFPVTSRFEISVAAIHEYTPGCNWSWHSIGSAFEARYFYKRGFNSCGTLLMAYPLKLKNERNPEYNDSKLEFAVNIHPFSYTSRCLFRNYLDFTIYLPPGIRLSKLYGGTAGEEYDWKQNFILIGVDVKINLCFLKQ